MSARNPKSQATLPNIPMDELLTFFGLKATDIYSETLPEAAQIDPHGLVAMSLHSTFVPEVYKSWNQSIDQAGYKTCAAMNPDTGDFFAYGRMIINHEMAHFFVSGNIQQIERNREKAFYFQVHFLTAGLEIEMKDAKNKVGQFYGPILTICRREDANAENMSLFHAEDEKGYYSGLCYGQDCLAAILADQPVDLGKNINWYDERVLNIACALFKESVEDGLSRNALATRYMRSIEYSQEIRDQLDQVEEEIEIPGKSGPIIH